MRSIARVVTAVAFLLPAACSRQAQVPVIDADVAIVNVTVVPMTEETVLENRTVLVKDGRIAAVAPTGTVAGDEDALVVDGTGKFLTPGLADIRLAPFALVGQDGRHRDHSRRSKLRSGDSP